MVHRQLIFLPDCDISQIGPTCTGLPFSAGKGLGSLGMHALGLCTRLLKEAVLALGSPLRVEQLVPLLVSVPASVPPLQLLCSRNAPAAHAHTLATQPCITTMALSVVPTA